jgi:integrase
VAIWDGREGVTGNLPATAVPARPAGLLEKLVAAIRPEFRAEMFIPDPADPVFGGQPCRVEGCGRPARARGMCHGHHRRWSDAGKPDVAGFAAVTGARLRGRSPLLACLVTGCGYGRRRQGLCSRHERAWRTAGEPEPQAWAAALPAVHIAEPPASCRVGFCELWSQGEAGLCWSHGLRWRQLGRPDLAGFTRRYDSDWFPEHECIDLSGLAPSLRLEMQYVLQRRHDQGRIKTRPAVARQLTAFLAASGAGSLLDLSESDWAQRHSRQHPRSGHNTVRALLRFACRQVDQLANGQGWDAEYDRDIWRLRNLGISGGPTACLYFDRIPQPWLRGLAKRWTRWRLATSLSAETAARGVRVLARFGTFLASAEAGVTGISQLDRAVLERYLADLHAGLAGTKIHREHIGQLSAFLQAVRRHQWDERLPSTAMFFSDDYPKPGHRLPRALPEQVMAQLENPASLSRWDNSACQLITVILIRCGLRLGDARRLPSDCIARDPAGAAYLRYWNHKMKREALVPIDEEVEQLIGAQQQAVRRRWPAAAPVLFPQPTANPGGCIPVSDGTYRSALDRWLKRCDIRDEHGYPVKITPHQWRHTLGTRLINSDVPQHVVQKILDHDSPMMTAHYARLSDATVRRHWEQARKVNARGQTITLAPGGPLADASWTGQQLARATQALPNGYCGLPAVRSCPHANACLTCPMFVTTAEFLPQHRKHRQQVLQIISAAEARGQDRLAEMNRQVAGNLGRIITTLEAEPGKAEAASAR